jgi:hypothetical protein
LRGRRQKAKEGDAEYRKVTTPVSELTMKHHMYHTAEQIAPANVNVFKIYQDENKVYRISFIILIFGIIFMYQELLRGKMVLRN